MHFPQLVYISQCANYPFSNFYKNSMGQLFLFTSRSCIRGLQYFVFLFSVHRYRLNPGGITVTGYFGNFKCRQCVHTFNIFHNLKVCSFSVVYSLCTLSFYLTWYVVPWFGVHAVQCFLLLRSMTCCLLTVYDFQVPRCYLF